MMQKITLSETRQAEKYMNAEENGKSEKSELKDAVEHLKAAEKELADLRRDEVVVEGEVAKALEEIERVEHHPRVYELTVNRKQHMWSHETIDGTQIKILAGSPAEWVVNQIVPGPGEDPEIGNDQAVNLAIDAPPAGIKRFTTRKPKTSPGAWTV